MKKQFDEIVIVKARTNLFGPIEFRANLYCRDSLGQTWVFEYYDPNLSEAAKHVMWYFDNMDESDWEKFAEKY